MDAGTAPVGCCASENMVDDRSRPSSFWAVENVENRRWRSGRLIDVLEYPLRLYEVRVLRCAAVLATIHLRYDACTSCHQLNQIKELLGCAASTCSKYF